MGGVVPRGGTVCGFRRVRGSATAGNPRPMHEISAGARLREMLFVLKPKPKPKPKLEDQELSPSFGSRVFFSVWPEKMNQKRGHPACAPVGHPVRPVRGRATGFFDSPSGNRSCVASTPASMPSPWAGEKLADIPVSHPCGAFLRPPAASEGPRVEQRAIVARTFRTSQSKSA